MNDEITYKLNMLQIRALQIQGPPNTKKNTQETKNTGIFHYMWSHFMQISYKAISL
jgi:hypothetical protein